MLMSNRPYDKLRIDFRDPALPLPTEPSTASPNSPNVTVEDDFFDDDAFSTPEVLASLEPSMSVPSTKASAESSYAATEDDFFNDDAFSSPEVLASLQP